MLPNYHRRSLLGASLAFALVGFAACTGGLTSGERAFVLPERLELRSSTAKVARGVGELKRGDEVTVTERATEGGTDWIEVRGPQGETGWAEARSVVSGEIVEQSRKLAEEVKDVQAQAVGRSKASLKLRLTPDRSVETNVATMLPAGTEVEILGRERRPRPAQEGKVEAKGAQNAEGEGGAGESPQYDLWLKVRLKDNGLLPVGYIYGGSVELEVPPEIMYFASSGRRIVGWQKLNAVRDARGQENNNYLVVERQLFGADEQSEFDRVTVLAYDPGARNYFTAFREDVRGRFPVALTMDGNQGRFSFTALDKNRQEHKAEYGVEILEGGKPKISRPGAAPTQPARRKR
jgi:hypothetical protein